MIHQQVPRHHLVPLLPRWWLIAAILTLIFHVHHHYKLATLSMPDSTGYLSNPGHVYAPASTILSLATRLARHWSGGACSAEPPVLDLTPVYASLPEVYMPIAVLHLHDQRSIWSLPNASPGAWPEASYHRRFHPSYLNSIETMIVKVVTYLDARHSS